MCLVAPSIPRRTPAGEESGGAGWAWASRAQPGKPDRTRSKNDVVQTRLLSQNRAPTRGARMKRMELGLSRTAGRVDEIFPRLVNSSDPPDGEFEGSEERNAIGRQNRTRSVVRSERQPNLLVTNPHEKHRINGRAGERPIDSIRSIRIIRALRVEARSGREKPCAGSAYFSLTRARWIPLRSRIDRYATLPRPNPTSV